VGDNWVCVGIAWEHNKAMTCSSVLERCRFLSRGSCGSRGWGEAVALENFEGLSVPILEGEGAVDGEESFADAGLVPARTGVWLSHETGRQAYM
jgi:hypothetical protein